MTDMQTIMISTDTAESIFRDMLIQDYKGLQTSVAELKAKETLEPYEQEDLDNDQRYIGALEIMLEYYIGADWPTLI
jgi:hypothetical protein